MTKKMNIMIYRQNIFFQINNTPTYECRPELVVTVPAACTSTVSRRQNYRCIYALAVNRITLQNFSVQL